MRIRVDHEKLSSLYFNYLEYRDEGFFCLEKEGAHDKEGSSVFGIPVVSGKPAMLLMQGVFKRWSAVKPYAAIVFKKQGH
jgi:hypothetical protein